MDNELQGPNKKERTEDQVAGPENPVVAPSSHTRASEPEADEMEEYEERAKKYLAKVYEWVRLVAWSMVTKVICSSQFWTAAATVAIAVSTVIYTRYAKKQWEVMSEQSSVMQKQLEMSERPWIVTEYTPNAPLEFTADGGATFEILGKMKNIGPIPLRCMSKTPLSFLLQEEGIEMLRPTAKQKETCDRYSRYGRKSSQNFDSGETLFPQDVAFERLPLRFPKEQVDRARAGSTDAILGLVIIGCVDYAFSFSPKHHQTGYVYDIVRPAPERIGSLPIKIGETLNPSQMIVRRSIFGGFYAD